jgi:hypothetical protein
MFAQLIHFIQATPSRFSRYLDGIHTEKRNVKGGKKPKEQDASNSSNQKEMRERERESSPVVVGGHWR